MGGWEKRSSDAEAVGGATQSQNNNIFINSQPVAFHSNLQSASHVASMRAWVAAHRRPRLGGYDGDGDAGGWLLPAPCD